MDEKKQVARRMTEEELERFKITAEFGAGRVLYDELCAERERFDAEVERRTALALELTAQLQIEKDRVDELERRFGCSRAWM